MSEMPEWEMERPRRKSWWARNWMWVVPVGCLAPLVVCCGIITLIVTVAFGAIKSSEVYQEAVTKAKEDKAVQAALGTPIQEGFFVIANMQINDGNGNADLTIPISGPKGAATIHAVAQRAADKWTFSTLEVAVEGAGNRINLLAKE